ncbi:MAG: TolC family protein [Rikenellaceae bacterium]
MKNLLFSAILLAITANGVKAQTPITLQQCMEYTLERNNAIKIQEIVNNSTKQDKTESIASLFPSLSASSSVTNSYGRSIDPETNTYTTSGNLSNSYGLYASVTVFSGLTNINAVRAARMRVEQGGLQLQQKKDEMAISAMKLFYDALYYEESVKIVVEQKEASEKVLKLTKKQLELGVKSEADVAVAAAEVANYDLLLTEQESSYRLAILDVKEAMNFPLDSQIELVGSDTKLLETLKTFKPFDSSETLEYNSEVQSAKSSLKESQINLKIAKGGYLPTISFGAGYNTNYFKMFDSDVAQRIFSDQIRDNNGYYFGASISIPIFKGLNSRINVIKSRNNVKIAELQLSQTELKVEKAIKNALLQKTSSLKEQIGAEKKIEANKLATRAMTKKYEQGIASIIDLQKSSNDLLLAKAAYARAKYNYQIQSIMVEYYRSGVLEVRG